MKLLLYKGLKIQVLKYAYTIKYFSFLLQVCLLRNLATITKSKALGIATFKAFVLGNMNRNYGTFYFESSDDVFFSSGHIRSLLQWFPPCPSSSYAVCDFPPQWQEDVLDLCQLIRPVKGCWHLVERNSLSRESLSRLIAASLFWTMRVPHPYGLYTMGYVTIQSYIRNQHAKMDMSDETSP